MSYIRSADGTRIHYQVTGRPGARTWRRILSEGAHRPEADASLVLEAMSHVPPLAPAQQAV